MKTRSQTKIVHYEVNIDFDEASRAWLSNKISTGYGTYKYVNPKPKSETQNINFEKVEKEETSKPRYNLRSKNK